MATILMMKMKCNSQMMLMVLDDNYDNVADAGDTDADGISAGENLIVNFSPGSSHHPGNQP